MRVNKLWVDQFKNLQNFEIEFNDAHLTTIVLGGNGTGKSNLLEALAIIFRDLDLQNRELLFEYYLVYECRGFSIEIDANPSQTRPIQERQLTLFEGLSARKRRAGYLNITIDGKDVSMKHFFDYKSRYLPKHVFGYYSGPTNRLALHFDPHQKRFYDEQRKGEDTPLRPLFFALPVHSQFVLLAYFSFPDPQGISFLKDYLGIVDLESVLFVVKDPKYGKVPKNDPFWGTTGVPRGFLQDLFEAALAPIQIVESIPLHTGQSTDLEHLYLFIKDKERLQEVAHKRETNKEFFKALDTLYISRLLSETRIRVKRVGIDGDLTFTELSEGEQQLLTVMGLLKFTRDSESLFLLDEPDTHLNPAWKWEYMNLIEPIVNPDGEEDTKCQILLASHDPIVIGSSVKEQVRVLTFEDGDLSGKITWFQPSQDPRGMGVAALLTSDVFGLRSSLDWQTQQELDLKRKLAAKKELTSEERQTLQELDRKLSRLGFNYEFRDPLYSQFLEARAKETENDSGELYQKPILTKEEQEKQAELAREIMAKLRMKA